MNTTGIAIIYLVYTSISIAMTIWVARTLFINGQVFLIDAFNGHKKKATSVNHLLQVGFYLINIGFVLLYLKSKDKPANLIEGIEFIATKLGFVLLVLGAMHFFNMWNINKMRVKAKNQITQIKTQEAT